MPGYEGSRNEYAYTGRNSYRSTAMTNSVQDSLLNEARAVVDPYEFVIEHQEFIDRIRALVSVR